VSALSFPPRVTANPQRFGSLEFLLSLEKYCQNISENSIVFKSEKVMKIKSAYVNSVVDEKVRLLKNELLLGRFN